MGLYINCDFVYSIKIESIVRWTLSTICIIEFLFFILTWYYVFSFDRDINEKLNTIKEWSFSTQAKAGCLLIGYEAFRTLVFFHSYKNRGNSPTRLEEIRENVNKYLLKPGM